jgi:hypothetical protein
VVQFYQDVQALGETAFFDQLKADVANWNTCSSRWGGGPGYKSDIGRWTDDWFSRQERRHRYEFIEQEIQRRWRELIAILDQQVTSQRSQEDAAAA